VKASEAKAKVEDAPQDVRFSLAVAAFGQKLRKEVFVEDYGWDSILDLGRAAKGSDAYGYRAEFLKLVELAKSLSGQ
jgi:Ca-activated chloride channel family protein